MSNIFLRILPMKICKQNVFERWPIETESCQLIATSPPYFNLRKYHIPDIIIGGDKNCNHEFGQENKAGICGTHVNHGSYCIHCNAWQGQYGLETTPFGDEHSYVEHTRLWAKEAFRVLKNNGVFFLNIADSYSTVSGGMAQGKYGKLGQNYNENLGKIKQPKITNVPSKCQLLIPHRVAIGLVEDGWTLRNTIIWKKENAMPESVTDRFSKKYEYVFMFSKQEKYYFDLDAVREPHKEVSIERLKRAVSNNNKWVNGAPGQAKQGLSQPRQNYKERIGSMQSSEFTGGDYLVGNLNPKGKNPGDIWQIPTQPSSEKHYAMWPERLVDRMVRCSTKKGDTVLDCFAGSCTTLKVAEELQRVGIGIELGYEGISRRRTASIQKKMFV